MKIAALLALSLFLAAPAFAAGDDYAHQLETARAARVAELTKADGWLTLIGLHFLAPGGNTVGRAADNRLALAAGPEHFGTVELAADGRVSFTAAADAAVRIDGRPAPAGAVTLLAGTAAAKPTLVSSGTVSFFVIERGGKKALRVRDSAAERRTRFLGIEYFPADPSWRIEARWVPFETPREIAITNVLGQVSREQVPGKAVFERDGKTYEVLPVVEGPDEPLFFILADATSGETTYPMRFLDAEPPKDGKVVLDFNRLENPPCAFTPFATCPLAPKENRLPLALTAGEKMYRGAHH